MDDPKNPVLLCRTEVDHGKTDAWMNETGCGFRSAARTQLIAMPIVLLLASNPKLNSPPLATVGSFRLESIGNHRCVLTLTTITV